MKECCPEIEPFLMKALYPEIEPFQITMLETDSQHKIYVEQSGNPDGIPVIFLHGGPCSGTKPKHRCFFNPELYHIILFDQRGCGLSIPFGELEANTTQDLIADMERIREHLNIQQWLLFGGSWGSTLALLYAQQYAENVTAMILRGTFLARRQDLNWFTKTGAPALYPEQYQILLASLPARNIDALYDTLWGNDDETVKSVTKAWMQWGAQVALGSLYDASIEMGEITADMIKQVKMELNYARHHYFIEENQVLKNCASLQTIPTTIIHGKLDFVCPIESGFAIAKALPQADYIQLETAGHIAQGDEMIDALVSATDNMAQRL